MAKCPGAKRYGETAWPGVTTSAGRGPGPDRVVRVDRSVPRGRQVANGGAQVGCGQRVAGAGGHHHDRLSRARADRTQPGGLGAGQQRVGAEWATEHDRSGRGAQRLREVVADVVAGREQQRDHDRRRR